MFTKNKFILKIYFCESSPPQSITSPYMGSWPQFKKQGSRECDHQLTQKLELKRRGF